ncbi:MAG: hypothetical protein JW726_00085 [Anaerolineales bacterium]|nr:hypothetical protein [Anaerolineales bacterium]
MEQVLDLLGDLLGLIFILVCLGLTIAFIVTSRSRSGVHFRDIPAFLLLRREVGSSVESGKRLHISLGRGDLLSPQASSALAGLTMLERCARAASISDCPPVVTSGESLLTVLGQDTLRNTYTSLGADRRYNPTSVRLTGLTPYAYAAGAMLPIHDENVNASILAGHLGAEAALLTEASERSKGISVAGSDDLVGQAVLFVTADEPLLGEELYTGGVYLSAGSAHSASLRMQDVMRWLLVAAMLIGALLKLLGGLL